MFLALELNRLHPSRMPFGEVPGAGAWSVIEQLLPRDVLILRVSPARSKVVPTIVLMDLTATASSLDQLANSRSVLRGAAILSTQRAQAVEQWTLDPLSEIRIGATEYCQQTEKLLKVTQFTTSEGRKFSVPYALASRAARGRRLWRAKKQAQSMADVQLDADI
ncbi:hypothetical protein [Burkholderia contaminans]|uniref:hypothetical protein n=1 Tax=Burkholderia contaminans TaxID=488447 RepID=UPI0008F54913|nr:hypothetical protein [Burkholderia contaminans]